VPLRWIVVGVLVLFASGTPAVSTAEAVYPRVTVEQARTVIQQKSGRPDFVILDVRTPEEFRQGHVAGAVNVNLMAPDFEARLGAFPRDKTYLVYCRTGNRSTTAVQIMERLKFRSVLHMFEGIVGWEQKGFPVTQ